MSKSPKRRHHPDEQAPPPPYVQLLLSLSLAVGQLANRFGTSFIILLILIGMVWTFGSDETQDDFIRELLFGELNRFPVLTTFVIGLTVDFVLGLSVRQRARKGESREFKRIAAEKTRLQEKLLGPLHHTEDEDS